MYILCLIYTYAPPPFEEDIIMTTTIIIAAKEITLYTLFFNIRVYALRIYTHQLKKELRQAIIFSVCTEINRIFRINGILSGIRHFLTNLIHLIHPSSDFYIIVDFLNSIFSFFNEPGIFPDT